MKLKQMKIYSPVMMLGVISILNGCSSKEGTMTNSTSQVEYEQKLEQDISIKEIYNQAANILLEADEKLILTLYYCSGYTTKEISKILKKKESMLSQRQWRPAPPPEAERFRWVQAIGRRFPSI